VHVWTVRAGRVTAFTEVMDTVTVARALGEVVAAQAVPA
jgi:ketosteroid isomerase-like protein